MKEIGRRERKVGVTPNLLEMMVMMVGIKQNEEWKEFSQMRQCWMASMGMTLLWVQSLWIFDRRPFLSKKSILSKSYTGNKKGGAAAETEQPFNSSYLQNTHNIYWDLCAGPILGALHTWCHQMHTTDQFN